MLHSARAWLVGWVTAWLALSWMLPCAFAQGGQTVAGVITGQVISTWDASPLPGVTVSVRGTTLATTTDLEGSYRLEPVPPGKQTVVFSRSGYARVIVTEVLVAAGQTSRGDVHLRPEFHELEEYVVTAPEMNEQTAQLLALRQNATALVDVIGAEQFSRVAASDAADIIGRVPGITVSEGKNPVVRGLNERYVGVLLNGAEVPSADPYKKSAQLDMFPAALIEEVTVTKSFTPDLPGNFSGGGVQMKTRSFPEQFLFNFSTELEYNERTTFRDDFPSYAGGGTDWLALDDGTRQLPDTLAAPNLKIPRAISNSGRPSSGRFEQRVAQADELDRLTRIMGPTEFRPTSTTAPPNHDLAFSCGDTVKLGEHDFGYFGGLSYKHKYLLREGENNRYAPGIGQTIQPRKLFADVLGQEDISWAAIANLAYRFNPEHQLGFTFLHNQNAENVARTQIGTISDDPGLTFVQNRLHWIERQLESFQLRGEHDLPALNDSRVAWLGALSTTTQEEPDARFFNFRTDGTTYEPDHQSLPTPNKPTRYFRDLEEENRNFKMDWTLPFAEWHEKQSLLKFGGYYSRSDRTFTDREIFYEGKYSPTDQFPFLGDGNQLFPPGSLGYTATTNSTGRIRYRWNRYIQSRDSRYSGLQVVPATYLMTELPVRPWLKVVGGFRFEQTSLQVDSVSYIANETTGLPVNSSRLERQDLLPAAGLIVELAGNLNVRVNYSQTLARPTFRELAAYRSYDPITDEILEGNPLLVMSDLDNYDLRWEWFPSPGEVMAVSLFYKDLRNAIERRFVNIGGEIVSYVNRPKAEVYGAEFEWRRNLEFLWRPFEDLTLGFNAAYIGSSVKLTPEEIQNRIEFIGDRSSTRPLYDQSPYIFNMDLTYDLKQTDTTLTVAFNMFGPRIVIAGLATPDVYEQPVPALDLILSQRIGEHWKLRFTAKNVLDTALERTYGENSDAIYSRYHQGRLFGLSVDYEY